MGMNSFDVVMDGTVQQVSTVLAGHNTNVTYINFQNPTGNDNVSIGGSGVQGYTLSAGGDKLWPERSLKNVYFKGTNGQTLNITWGSGGN